MVPPPGEFDWVLGTTRRLVWDVGSYLELVWGRPYCCPFSLGLILSEALAALAWSLEGLGRKEVGTGLALMTCCRPECPEKPTDWNSNPRKQNVWRALRNFWAWDN